MIKKINNHIIIIISSLLLVILSIMISFQIITMKTNIERVLNNNNYYEKTSIYIHNKMTDYINEDIVNEVLTKEQIKSDIKRSINTFYQHKLIDINKLKDNTKLFFEVEISAYLKNNNLETNDESISILSSKLSDIYVSNIFVLDELNKVSKYYNLSKYLIIIEIVIILFLIIIFIYRKNLFPIILSTTSLLLLSSLIIKNNFYYLNDFITNIINNIINDFKITIIFIVFIYLILYLYFRVIRNKR